MKVIQHHDGRWGVRRFAIERLGFVYLDFHAPGTHIWWPRGHHLAAGIYTTEIVARQWMALLPLRYTTDGNPQPWGDPTLAMTLMTLDAVMEYPAAKMSRGLVI